MASNLFDLCIRCVAANFQHITNLAGIPAHIIHQLFDVVVANRKLTDSNLEIFLDTELETLNLQNNSHLRDSSLKKIERCTNLIELNLKNCHNVSSATLGLISQKCVNIQTLDLSGCTQVDDGALKSIAFYLNSSLTSLHLNGCYQVTNQVRLLDSLLNKGLAKLSMCTNLRDLDLSYCHYINGSGLATLTQRVTLLETLNLSYCSQIRDTDVTLLAQRCRSLKSIELCHCKQLTDIAIQGLAVSCPLLERVNLSHCSGITDTGIQHLAQGCVQLQSLDLSDTNVTDNSVQHLAHFSSKLRSLSLKRIRSISDESVCTLIAGCALEELDLDGCSKITDQIVTVLGGCAARWKKLNISFCRAINSQSIPRLVNTCSNLVEISLWGHKVNHRDVKRQCQRPQLRVLCS